ncbi:MULTISPECIES: hypothetical protein [unclassified Rhodanobacter]|uniref:hypothetical protein n=1 Tax=unclassified Rhodanobacter TaxID=2621553 RepID=UPI001BDF437F|nr:MULTISPECIES: hypothetical protein [unclassified Rhodanobacter]MBT2142701.1 hypothetical protein [Rhodanobacter sp. LX-99]MBT2148226.1 hypothetical protein [Rhodanobacter sp. LX-100]
MTTNELFGKDRPMLMERLGRLLGSSTFTTPESGGGTPFSSRKLTAEAEMLLALKLAQTHPGDVGPWLVYSIALQIDDRQREIVQWLAGKLERGTGVLGKRNAPRLLITAHAAYQLAVHGLEPKRPKTRPADYLALVNIGAGWLWMKCESAIDRAEFASGRPRSDYHDLPAAKEGT